MNNKDAMNNHLNNLSNQVGEDVRDKYRFIVSSQDLERSFYESRRDLHYALKKETKRDRYIVMNSQALEREIERACAQALQGASYSLFNYLESLAYDVFESYPNKVNANKYKNEFIKIFVRAFIQSAFKIFEQSINSNDDI